MESESLAFLHTNYGQRTEKRELRAFNELVEFFNIEEKLIFDLTHLNKIGGSCLTDKNISVPEANLENI